VPQKQPHYTEPPISHGYKRVDRVRRRYEYLHIQRCSRKVHTAHFVFLVLANEERRRLGITVSKRVSNAVGRNRIKRVVREVFRINRHLFPDKSDVVVVARSGAEKLNYERVREEIKEASSTLKRVVHVSQ
jgi:ribonuclease P protein component